MNEGRGPVKWRRVIDVEERKEGGVRINRIYYIGMKQSENKFN